MQRGAVESVHLKGGTGNGTGFLFEIHGTEGALAIVPADPRHATNIQVSEFTVRGAQAGKPLADLSIPESYRGAPRSSSPARGGKHHWREHTTTGTMKSKPGRISHHRIARSLSQRSGPPPLLTFS